MYPPRAAKYRRLHYSSHRESTSYRLWSIRAHPGREVFKTRRTGRESENVRVRQTTEEKDRGNDTCSS